MNLNEYKCPRCNCVHTAIPHSVASESTDSSADFASFFQCSKCGHPSSEFVPAQSHDAPQGCTIQGVVVPGVFEDKKERDDFEPLTPEQYAVLSKAAPAQRGKIVSSLLDPHRKRRRTRELQKPLANVSKDDVMPERGKPALFSYTDDAGHLLRQIADYVRRRAEVPDLGIVLHGSTLTHAEVDGVLGDADSVEAAARLIAAKLDRLS